MSVQAMVWVFEFSKSKGLDKLVLLSLANRHNLERRGCWPSRSTIAVDCGVHDATVKRSLGNLENLGEVSIEERPRESGPHRSNFYRLPLVEKWLAEGRSQHPRGADSTPPRGAYSAKEGCSQHPEPVIEPVRNKNLRPLARPSSVSCGNSGKAKPAMPQQRRYAIVRRLTEAACEILARNPSCELGDLAEELKRWAANNLDGPYFDALPGAATPIEQAITNAMERRKTA
jgi:hypothetical protein